MITCSFNTKTARDEVRRLIGINEPSVLTGLNKDQNRKCRMKDGNDMPSLLRARTHRSCALENGVHDPNHGHVRSVNATRCSVCGRGGTGTRPKEGGLILICAPKPDVRRWSTLGVTRYTREVLSETCFREIGKAPIRTLCVETDKRQPGRRNISGREARAARTHTAAGATEDGVVGDRHGCTWKNSCGTCRRANGVRPRTVVQESICRGERRTLLWAVATQLVRHRRFRAKLGGGACFDTQQPQYDERYQVPLRSERLHQE